MSKRKELRDVTQKELRRLLVERKPKLSHSNDSTRIQSPLAKYDQVGNLSCIICRSHVRSNTAWKVHINSRLHKANIGAAKELQTNLLKKSRLSSEKQENINLCGKESGVEYKKVLETASNAEGSSLEKEKLGVCSSEIALPENFFDVQLRQHDCRDLIEEEWQKFQKEIKEESLTSTAIIAGEQEVATIDRQIREINEQISLWSKVITLEDKKNGLRLSHLSNIKAKETENGESGDDSDTFEEFPNWRLKNFIK